VSERVYQDERLWAAQPFSQESDEALISFVLDALGCATEPVHRRPKPPRTTFDVNHHGAVTRTWQLATPSCTIALERTEDYFAGDVNQPATYHEHLQVLGARNDQAITVRVHAGVGDREMVLVIDATIEDWARILDSFKRRFGEFG
jgi:hypothetical protein